MKRTDKITAMAALVALMAAPLAAQQKATDEGMVFTEEEVNPPQKEMVFTEGEVDDTPPEIEDPEADPCGNPDEIDEVLGDYKITVGPAYYTYTGAQSGSRNDSAQFNGTARLTYDFTRDQYILTAQTDPIGNMVVTMNRFGNEQAERPDWGSFFSDFTPSISRDDIALATGCDDLPELDGYGTGTGGMNRHKGFPVDIRMKMTYIPGLGGQFAGVMQLNGHTTDGLDVTYKVQVVLER